VLALKNRLHKKKDFERVLQDKNKPRYANKFLAVRFAPNHLNVVRAGFVVTKKAAKKAVCRNKIKRRLREAFRRIMPNVSAGFDIIFFARAEVQYCAFEEIIRAIQDLLYQAGLWRSSQKYQQNHNECKK